MFAQTFYHGHLRKYVVLFGTLFNDIYINRVDRDDGAQLNTLKVPITYAPKDKLLARVDGDPELNRPVAQILPRMSFELNSLSYAPTRKLSTVKKGYVKQDAFSPERLKYIYNPVPYDLNFSLYIAVKNTEDGTRILEQILPYFTPEWTTTIKLIPELDVILDIPTVLTSVSSQDTYDGQYIDRRALVWTLDFSMKGYIFGPVKKSEVITLANVNFYTTIDNEAPVEENITITPGLTSNGQPTSNAQLTIDRSLISSNSNYGYIINIDQV
jgi:hypothetical protein